MSVPDSTIKQWKQPTHLCSALFQPRYKVTFQKRPKEDGIHDIFVGIGNKPESLPVAPAGLIQSCRPPLFTRLKENAERRSAGSLLYGSSLTLSAEAAVLPNDGPDVVPATLETTGQGCPEGRNTYVLFK
jgi:hypothetical protein